MAASERVDVFSGVHKGLRKALFALALQAGTADAAAAGDMEALRRNAAEVFHFLEHHALNEDNFLMPEMRAKAMPEAARMQEDHAALDAELLILNSALPATTASAADLHAFYLALNHFIAAYLLHIHEEETAILPALQARFTDAELAVFPRQSVAATAPQDQEMMLSHIFPAMTLPELRSFFTGMRAKAPPEAIAHVEGIARKTLGDKARILFTP